MNKIIIKFPGFKSKAFTMSFDDGHDSDIPLVKLLLKYDLKASFNICSGVLYPEGADIPVSPHGHRPLTEKAALELYDDPHFEVVSHGYEHQAMGHIPTPDAIYDMLMDRRKLEGMFGKLVRGLAYPYGSYSPEAIECAKLCGFVYGRVVSSDTSLLLPESDKWMEWHPTNHMLDEGYDYFIDEFIAMDNSYYHGKLFFAWAHSFEFLNCWDKVEEKLKRISGHKDIWYATNIEIHDYVEAYRSLVYYADCTKVYNPTQIDVYIGCDAGNFCIPAGETVTLIK